MHDATLSVPDIHCGHCKSSIEGAVGELDGVSNVDVSIETRTVDVRYAEPSTRTEIIAAIEGQGYEVA
ncbi:MAG: heavy-metal-associated domain-containing protein [Acidimicrobiia bacterium]